MSRDDRLKLACELMRVLADLLDACAARGLDRAGHQAILDRISALTPDDFLTTPPGSARILRFPTARR